MRLKGKVAIVTGSGQGIGKEIALTFAREGCKVIVSDITCRASDVADEIKSSGGEAVVFHCDVSKFLDAEKLVKTAVENFGRIDILVNNAGIYPMKAFTEMSEADWDRVIGVNLKGNFNCCKVAVPHMVRKKYGKIINITSIAGSVVGFPQLVHYSASKGGITGFTRALAMELAPHGINVNAIAPGPVETPGTGAGSAPSEMYEQTRKSIPLGRWGRPADIASLALFLASDESDFITGQCIVADGGYTIQ